MAIAIAQSLLVDDGCLVPKKTAVEVNGCEILSCWPKIEFTRTYLKILLIASPKSNPRLMSMTSKQWLSSQLGLISAYYYLECLIKESSSKMAIVEKLQLLQPAVKGLNVLQTEVA